MGLRRLGAGYAIVYVILLCTLAMGSIEGKRRADMLFGNCDPELEAKMAEQAWIHCWKEFVDRNGSFEDFDLDTLQEASFELKSRLLTRENIDESPSVLSPKMKQELLDYCLRQKNLHFSYHEDSSRHSVIKCVRFLLDLCNSHRGYLASNTRRQTKPGLTPPPEAASPGYGPAPFNLVAASSSSPRRNDPFVLRKESVSPTRYEGSSNKIGPGGGKRDERPLLNFNLSNNTSQSSFSLGNSSSKEHSSNSGNTNSFQSILSTKHASHESSLEETPSEVAHAGEALPPLKPPPGRPPAPPPPGPPPPPPNSSEGDDLDSEEAPKAKLKPFFWDKVVANRNHSMVWDEISSGSFQFSEEMIESLFGYNAVDNSKNDRKRDPSEPLIQYIQIINPRKAQNLSILLRALNVTTEEVLNALQEGNELPVELLQTLLKMAPTSEEELKLRLYAGDISQLGPAERFLKVLVEIPFAFRRIEALIFMSSLQEEVSSLKESFATLELATKLRNSRLFLKLLEAVLKTGNRMNDGTYRGGAQAFKLDTLLKLSDVKGIDGKTTLLHFVVEEIIRSEGIRAVRTARPSLSFSSVKSDEFIDNSNPASAEHYRNLGLQVVSGLSTELEDVRKAAIIDANVLTSTVSKLNQSLTKTKAFVDSDLKSLGEDGEFYHALASFLERAASEISSMSEEEKRITALVKSTADYFHGNAGMDEGLRLFTIVRDFLIMIDKTCREVRDDRSKRPITKTKKEVQEVTATNGQKSENAIQKLFPAIVGRRTDDSSSDDEIPSP
ncbi:FORMIN-RELATED [Salix viminalis]|uniref:Formin-like protein n=1 Tax=Salix viminalis TaxID=40686 RepID=A0A9Q0SI73_SALVM|nr:FORMIN-RELATED [Salix viminalis]